MNIMKWRSWFFGISLSLVIVSLLALALFKLELSIDFTGGSLLEITTEKTGVNTSTVKETLSAVYPATSVQSAGEDRFLIKGPGLAAGQEQIILSTLSEIVGQAEITRLEVVGPTISGELLYKTMIASIVVIGVITLYIWKQFSQIHYGIAAVLAMLHDSIILLGAFSLFGRIYGTQVDILFVTALLTTLSFSVHDTVVVFDRIRELRNKRSSGSLVADINQAVTETLTRSLNNSITIVIMLTSLVLLGGETIRWFAVALLLGAIVGTYSSTFLAAPLLIVGDSLLSRKKR